MGIFDKKKEISRRELRYYLRNSSPYVPGGGFFNCQERMELEKKIDKIFGDYINESEFKKAIKKLRVERYNAKTQAEKIKLGRAIRYLEEIVKHSPKEEKLEVKKENISEKRTSKIRVLRRFFGVEKSLSEKKSSLQTKESKRNFDSRSSKI